MRSSMRCGAVALIAVCALAACSSGSAKPATAPGIPTSPSELAALYTIKVPSRFNAQPNAVGDTGPSDLAKAIKDDGSPDAATALRAEGFVRGYQRLWIGPDQDQIIVFLYQFKSPTGAQSDFRRVTTGRDKAVPGTFHEFAVKGMPAGDTIGTSGSTKHGMGAAVNFTTGVYDVQVLCFGSKLGTLETRATSVAADQRSRLQPS